MSDLPITTSMRPRPIMLRLLEREAGLPLPPPNEQEKGDAIRVLEAGATDPDDPASDPLYAEAERVLTEG